MRKIAILLIFSFTHICFPSEGNSIIDSLKFIVKNTTNDSLRYEALYKLAISHLDSAYEVSIAYWDEAIGLAKQKRLWIKAADAHHQKGYMLYKKGELLSGLNNFKEALSIYEQVNKEKEMGEVLNDIGLVYRTWGKYELAIDNYQFALKIFSKINYDEGIGMASNNIGQIYFYRDDYLKAIDYFKIYLEINQKLKYSRAVAAASNNIATAYMELGSFDLAYNFFYKSLQIYDSLEINLGVAIIQDNIGSLYYKKNQLNDAILYHTQALQAFEELGNLSYQSNTLKNIGLAHFKLANYAKAKIYYRQSALLAENLNKAETLKEVYYNLAQLYDTTKHYKEALDYFKKYLQVKDSLLTVETAEKLAIFEGRINTEQQTNDLIILKAELKSKQAYLKLGFAMFFFLIPSIVFIVILIFRNKKQSEKLKNISVETSEINFILPNYQESVLFDINKKFKYFHQWHSKNYSNIKFGTSSVFKENVTVISIWQIEGLVVSSFYKILVVEGIVSRLIEQQKEFIPNEIAGLYRDAFYKVIPENKTLITTCVIHDHVNKRISFLEYNNLLIYNKTANTIIKNSNESSYSTNEDDNLLFISVNRKEKLPEDFYINMKNILQSSQKGLVMQNESLDGLFELLEMSSPELSPIQFVALKP